MFRRFNILEIDMDIASAMMSINAVKGVNIGSGMNAAKLTGEENSDEILKEVKTIFKTNNAGESWEEYQLTRYNNFICG